jgi:hypothetical protein
MKHPHCELIKLWADGADIQRFYNTEWRDVDQPDWYLDCQYRLKPKEPVKRDLYWFNDFNDAEYAKAIGIFDSDTNALISVEIERP